MALAAAFVTRPTTRAVQHRAQVCNGVTRVCGPCTNDAQCQRGLDPAVAAQVVRDEDTLCTGCQELEDVGCRLDGDQPICDGGTCRGCVADADCDTHHPGTQCVRGRCQECDPSSQAGCDELAPICGSRAPVDHAKATSTAVLPPTASTPVSTMVRVEDNAKLARP